MVHPLSQELNGGLGPIHLFGWHVKVIWGRSQVTCCKFRRPSSFTGHSRRLFPPRQSPQPVSHSHSGQGSAHGRFDLQEDVSLVLPTVTLGLHGLVSQAFNCSPFPPTKSTDYLLCVRHFNFWGYDFWGDVRKSATSQLTGYLIWPAGVKQSFGLRLWWSKLQWREQTVIFSGRNWHPGSYHPVSGQRGRTVQWSLMSLTQHWLSAPLGKGGILGVLYRLSHLVQIMTLSGRELYGYVGGKDLRTLGVKSQYA